MGAVGAAGGDGLAVGREGEAAREAAAVHCLRRPSTSRRSNSFAEAVSQTCKGIGPRRRQQPAVGRKRERGNSREASMRAMDGMSVS